jgi:hypothetical protein
MSRSRSPVQDQLVGAARLGEFRQPFGRGGREMRIPEDACDLAQAYGEVGWTARLASLTVDGLIYASSMVMLDSTSRTPAGIAFSVVTMHCQCRLPLRKA